MGTVQEATFVISGFAYKCMTGLMPVSIFKIGQGNMAGFKACFKICPKVCIEAGVAMH